MPSHGTLKSLFKYIKDAIKESKVLSKFEQLLLCLIRLRLGVSVMDLSKCFQVSKTTVSRLFLDMLEVLYVYLKPLINAPERPELQISIPQCFIDSFERKITVIIDCFELYIDQPKNLIARNLTWSSYKHHHTAKYLIGITPQGSLCFISGGWGGRSSDQHITENSNFLRKINHDGKVMADRGFNISETLGTYGAQLVIPSFTTGKKQLNPEDVKLTRQIANVRIHSNVERVIRSIKQKYSLLDRTLLIDFLLNRDESLTTLDKIVLICCALVNLCPSVVPFQ